MDKFLTSRKRLYTTSRGGYITLISVLIVGAVGISVAVSLILLGIGAARTSFAMEQSAQARALAGACLEGALLQIHDTALCAGGGEVLFDRGSCISVVTGDSSLCTVKATGTIGNVVRRAKVLLSGVSPVPAVSSWKEVADF